MLRTQIRLLAPLFALVVFASNSSARGPGANTGKGGTGGGPVDLVMLSMSVNEAKGTVTATVRLEGPANRPGLAGRPVQLRVAGAGQILFQLTQNVDLPMNVTKTVTFQKVNFAALKAQLAQQQPLQAVRLLSVSATVDPANTVPEANETNNSQFRILPVN